MNPIIVVRKPTPFSTPSIDFQNLSYLGLDILTESGSKPSERFYAAYFESKEKQELFDRLSYREVLTLIKKYRPNFVITDSLTEFGSEKKSIMRFLSRLPPDVSVVVATKTSNHTIPVQTLAKKIGIKVNRKLSALQTAQVVVQLVKRGYGQILDVFDDEVLILVSRPRSKGKGGWSQRRFERSLDEIVQRATRDLIRDLENLGFDFETYSEKSNQGLRSSRIIVYGDATKVFSSVNTKKYHPAVIKLVRKPKNRFKFLPLSATTPSVALSSSSRKLIVGLDPGLTFGIALVDLDGRIVKTASIKHALRSEILDFILSHGSPLIVCSDVSPMPKQVEKIASLSNAIKFSPPHDLSKSEKKGLTENFRVRNAHEMDALAAALKGYKSVRSTIEKIQSQSQGLSRSQREAVIALVLRGLPIEEAKALIRVQQTDVHSEEDTILSEEQKISMERYLRLLSFLSHTEETIQHMQEYQAQLLKDNEFLAKEVDELQAELRRRKSKEISMAMASEEVRQKSRIINQLRDEIDRLRAMLRNAEKQVEDAKQMLWLRNYMNGVPVRVLKRFTNSEIEKADRIYHLQERDVFYFEDVSGGGRITAELIGMLNPKAIIYRKGEFTQISKYELLRRGIPIFKEPKTGFLKIGEIGVITQKALEEGIKQGEQEIIEFERKLTKEKLEAILSEYREARKELDDDGPPPE